MRKSHILALTAVAALGSSLLVPSDAFARGHGFAHAAQASRSVHAASTGGRTASVGFRRSAGFQHAVSSSRVVSGSSFTQRRFGSANTAAGHSFSFGNRFSMANRTMGHTTTPTNIPQFNKLANGLGNGPNNTVTNHSALLTGPHSANDQTGKKTQTPTNAQVVTDLTNRASADTSKASQDFKDAQRLSHKAGDHEKDAQKDRREGDRLGALKQEQFAATMKADAEKDTKNGDKELNAAKIDTTAANGLANKGSSNKTGSGDKTGTGGKGGGTGGNTNANNTPGGGNHPRPFPGQFPGMIGMGHGPFVGGQVAVGGSIGPVAVAPVAPVSVAPVASSGALPPLTRPSALRPPAPSCLSKTYLQTGLVMFRDVCSQEWAMNSSSVTNPAPTNSACLSKENPQNGVVLFKDNCTSEWAMNPQPDNQAQN